MREPEAVQSTEFTVPKFSEDYTFEKHIHKFTNKHTYEITNHTFIYDNNGTFIQNEKTNLRAFNKLFGEPWKSTRDGKRSVCVQSVLWYMYWMDTITQTPLQNMVI